MKITSPIGSKGNEMEPTNKDRAAWAMVAVNAFAEETGMDNAGEELPAIVGDLLADIMHLCNQNGIDFAQVLDTGKDLFDGEIIEEADALENASALAR
jgi:hypothetical protein